ncbi:hypothetical protein ROHU_009928 [Labeo rohita]|uniref:Uncharacterized protein n=1 Tax=Labeo rohita TaxID=84645 RepID=A0A498LWU1_LABRO|nr:hypothetical protein ROHU_009928 [Labeo rohita]
MFEVKVFSPETKENELLSVINTVCSYWTNNKGKNEDELAVLKTFRIMLLHLDENKEIDNFCAKLNCTDSYMVRHINTTTFRAMYKNSCGGSVSATIIACSGLLVVSLVLNVVLTLKVSRMQRHGE